MAVSDSFDTLTAERSQDGYIVPLKNIINEAYSKDISRRVSSALDVKRRAGEFIGSWAAYGYRKCAEDKHRIEPDPATAPIVREIFSLRLGGMSFNKTAKRLNDDKIPTPAQYLHQIGSIKTDRYDNAKWVPQVVKKITESEVYLGHMVQGRKKSDLCQGLKQHHTQKSDWIIVENTHEPLIDESVFRAVQAMAEKAKEAYYANLGVHDHLGSTPNILRGLIFCADCGRPLVRYKQVTNKGKNLYYTYICQTHSNNPAACPKKYLHEAKLKEILWTALQREVELCADMKKLVDKHSHSPAVVHQSDKLERRLATARQALIRYTSLFDSLYQNYVDRLMDEQEYMELKRQYRGEIERLQAEIVELEHRQAEQNQQTVNNPWLTNFTVFAGEDSLTEKIAHALILRVDVYSDDRVEITLKYQDEYQVLKRLLDGVEEAVSG